MVYRLVIMRSFFQTTKWSMKWAEKLDLLSKDL